MQISLSKGKFNLMISQGIERPRLSISICIHIYRYISLSLYIGIASPAAPMLILACIHIYANIGKNTPCLSESQTAQGLLPRL